MTFDQAVIIIRDYIEGRRAYDWCTWAAFKLVQPVLASRRIS